MQISVQMDPMEGVNVQGDTTFALCREALQRGFKVYTHDAPQLRLESGRVTALSRQVLRLSTEQGRHVDFAPPTLIDLGQMDVVLVRQDPPFDLAYITAAHILEKLPASVLVLNDPAEIRNAPEKLFVMDYPDLMPPTLVTADPAALTAFRAQHQDVIIKPLYGNGGAGVFRLRPDDQNFRALLEMFLGPRPVPVIAQAYLPAVRAGDKRIILLDGEPVGAINRVPADGEARSNMHAGGRPEPTALTPRDIEICTRIAPELQRRRLVLTGIDVIGDYITEINVTSPTGIQEIRRFGGADIAALFWDHVCRLKGIAL